MCATGLAATSAVIGRARFAGAGELAVRLEVGGVFTIANACHIGIVAEAPGASVCAQVVAYDFGIKHNILRRLASFGCRITVVPADYPASKVLDMNPDGIFLSNGPVSAS